MHIQAALLLPILLPFLTAVLCLFLRKNTRAQHVVSLIGSLSLVAAAVFLIDQTETHEIIVLNIAGWELPYGIALVSDMLAALMVGISAFVGLMANIYSFQNIDERRKEFGFFTFFHFLLMGVNGAFIAGDIFNLYVWFEVMLIASFVLLALGNGKQQLIGSVKYMLLSFIASSFLLIGVAMVYGLTGSLNMADVALYFRENSSDPLITVAAMLFLLPFAIKSAMFPVYFWLPASYPTPPIAVSAIFAGLLTKVGVYTLLRFFTLIFVQDIDYTHTILLVAALLTMLSGVLGAVSMGSMRKILSFHIISQIGYMVLGIALFTPFAIAGTVFYIIHHIIVKTNLFLIAGVVEKIKGSSVLDEIGGLYRHFPLLSLLFLIPAFSLAGLPPLSGFWAKFILIKAGFETEAYFAVAIALITGILTLYSMTKIWNNAFWKKDPGETAVDRVGGEAALFKTYWPMLLPIVIMAAATLFIGFHSAPLMKYAMIAAEQLMNQSLYIEMVLSK
ncbi:MAG: proton-conducting transporter membrane subunit [Chitinophagales bacterium]